MKPKLAGALWCIAVTVGALLGLSSDARAAVKWGCWKYPKSTIYFYNGASGSYYTAFREEGLLDSTAWSPWTDAQFSQVSTHAQVRNINCYSGFYGYTGWAGLAQIVKHNGCFILDGHASINRTYADSYSMTYKKHLACHEIGHLLGLDHTPSKTSCMNNGTTAAIYSIHTGDASDRALVNSLY